MKQSSNVVLMVRPAHFAYNEETAKNNAFMRPAAVLTATEIVARARDEFERLVSTLRNAGVQVVVVDDTPDPIKPDAVFPNNWFSTHAPGIVVTYPMYAPTRRAERKIPVLPQLDEAFSIHRTIALEYAEEDGQYLEGTGAMVLDRVNRICYLCISERSHPDLAQRWCDLLDYSLVAFEANDENGLPIYHTNVLLAIGTSQAILCSESIAPSHRARVQEAFAKTGHTVIDISFAQMNKYAGNALEVVDGSGQRRWAMSTQAYQAFTVEQRQLLEIDSPILHADITAIEQLGGGSARCMIAEVFLTPKT